MTSESSKLPLDNKVFMILNQMVTWGPQVSDKHAVSKPQKITFFFIRKLYIKQLQEGATYLAKLTYN